MRNALASNASRKAKEEGVLVLEPPATEPAPIETPNRETAKSSAQAPVIGLPRDALFESGGLFLAVRLRRDEKGLELVPELVAPLGSPPKEKLEPAALVGATFEPLLLCVQRGLELAPGEAFLLTPRPRERHVDVLTFDPASVLETLKGKRLLLEAAPFSDLALLVGTEEKPQNPVYFALEENVYVLVRALPDEDVNKEPVFALRGL